MASASGGKKASRERYKMENRCVKRKLRNILRVNGEEAVAVYQRDPKAKFPIRPRVKAIEISKNYRGNSSVV